MNSDNQPPSPELHCVRDSIRAIGPSGRVELLRRSTFTYGSLTAELHIPASMCKGSTRRSEELAFLEGLGLFP